MLEFALFQSARTVITMALGIYLAIDLWRLNRTGPAFAVQKIFIDPENRQRCLSLQGRQTGIVAWVYTRLGLEADARLELSAHDIRIERQSLKGFELLYAPAHDLSCSSCGYYRAVSLALIAVSLLVGGFMQLYTAWGLDNPYQRLQALSVTGPTAIAASIFAVVAYCLFEISKRMAILVETQGGEKMGIALKRNVIDNITIGISESRKAAAVLNTVILEASGRVRVVARDESIANGAAE